MRIALQPLTGAAGLGRRPFALPSATATVSVGRASGNELRLDDTSVSSVHAKIETSESEGLDLVDCDSSNGTFVNGVRVKRRGIGPGDLIRFASVEFRVIESNGDVDDQSTEPLTTAYSSIETKTQTVVLPTSTASPAIALELRGELDSTRAELADVSVEAARLRAEVERLGREIAESERKQEKARRDIASEREANLERESRIATLEYELGQKDADISALESRRQAALGETDQWRAAHEESVRELAAIKEELVTRTQSAVDAIARCEMIEAAAASLSRRLLVDWKIWFDGTEMAEIDADDPFAAVGLVADRIRAELDLIEPIWSEFGEGVRAELERRCENVRIELKRLEEEKVAAVSEGDRLSRELEEVRQTVDEEVRRARSLSRRGTMVELPKRYETMVIASDREQGFYRSLIERIEYFDQLLSGYRSNRKMKEVVEELDDLRNRFAKILEQAGVEEFEIEVGTELTLKHRKEVQILGRKGWGTREFVEQTFRPGEVVKVIRTGYRAGAGEGSAVLRKTEVLIREANN